MSNVYYQDPSVGGYPQQQPAELQAGNYSYQPQNHPVELHAGGNDAYNPTHEKSAHGVNPDGSRKWENGMCGCFGDIGACCTGYWCPCILFGKTHHRLRNPNMEKYSCCNANCMGYAVLATILPPFYVILGMKQRAEIRQTYNLEGGGCGDYFRSLCCSCCSVIQEEREVAKRAKVNMSQGYQAPNGMTYGH